MIRRVSPLILSVLALLVSAAPASEVRDTSRVKAIKRAFPAVVNIHTEKSSRDGQSVFDSGKGRKINGMGTGVVVDERGYIVTNYHVIAEVDLIRATLHDRGEHLARVVSFDREHDLALIKVDAPKTLTVAPFGTSSDLMLGETVLAIGNAFGYHGTVTEGIISAIGRDVEVTETQCYKNLIQTDASINPGNSGGPLINLEGDVIGINVAIRAGAQRIGFTIPIDDARKVIAKLISVEQLQHATHGVSTRDVKSANSRMLVVEGLTAESPAATAGLKPGDVVLKVGTTEVSDGVDFERAFLGRNVGEAVEITVRRQEKTEKLSLALVQHQHGRSSLSTEFVSNQKVVPPAEETDADRFWKALGLKLTPLPASQRNLVAPKYNGGMRVVDVRPDGPAALNGIKKGDILVGLQQWETLTPANIDWILNQPLAAGQLKFFLIRGQETLYGHLQPTQLASKPR